MKRKFNKIVLASVITLSILGLCLIFSPKKIAAANSANIRYITTCVGETENEIGISFHSNVQNNEVLLSTTQSFTNALTIPVTSTSFEQGPKGGESGTAWSQRYVCKAMLKDLKESTKYYFKIKALDTNEFSEVRSFTTLSKTKEKKIFFGTDIHTSAGYTVNSINSNENASKIMSMNKGIDLILDTGDAIDRGGFEAHWARFYQDMTSYENKLIAKIPGNHEYYHTSDSGYIDPSFFNMFAANPQNGPEERLNSTYYFKYGNALFIMLDTIDRKFPRQQKEWFKAVIANNPSEWIIVGTHAGFYSCGVYAHDTKWNRDNWKFIFEECQVDLVLSGHEHVYIRKDLEYKKTTDQDLGTTYYVSPALGNKQYGATQQEGIVSMNANNTGNVITINDNELKVQTYIKDLTTGKIVEHKDKEFILKPKRSKDITPISDEEILNSLHFEYDQENETAKLIWDQNLYGNVKNIEVTKKFDEITDTKKYTVSSNKYNYRLYDYIFKDTNYSFDIILTKSDGSNLSKTLTITNYINHNITTNLNGGEVKGMPKYYTEGIAKQLPIPTKDKANFLGWYLTEDFSGDPITKIKETDNTDLTLYAKWANIYNIEYILNEGKLDNPVNTYTEGEKLSLPTPTKEKGEFQGWYLTPDFSGKSITEISPTQQGDIKLYAKWKKGCSCKKNAPITELLSSLAMLYFVFRKRK